MPETVPRPSRSYPGNNRRALMRPEPQGRVQRNVLMADPNVPDQDLNPYRAPLEHSDRSVGRGHHHPPAWAGILFLFRFKGRMPRNAWWTIMFMLPVTAGLALELAIEHKYALCSWLRERNTCFARPGHPSLFELSHGRELRRKVAPTSGQKFTSGPNRSRNATWARRRECRSFLHHPLVAARRSFSDACIIALDAASDLLYRSS